MGLRKDVSLIKEELSLIKEKMNKLTDETIRKANAYDELKNYLKHIKLDVSNVSVQFDTELIKYCVKIDYHMPSLKVYIDKDNNVERNESFIAINMLDLISLKDMNKISEKLEDIKKINKK